MASGRPAAPRSRGILHPPRRRGYAPKRRDGLAQAADDHPKMPRIIRPPPPQQLCSRLEAPPSCCSDHFRSAEGRTQYFFSDGYRWLSAWSSVNPCVHHEEDGGGSIFLNGLILHRLITVVIQDMTPCRAKTTENATSAQVDSRYTRSESACREAKTYLTREAAVQRECCSSPPTQRGCRPHRPSKAEGARLPAVIKWRSRRLRRLRFPPKP